MKTKMFIVGIVLAALLVTVSSVSAAVVTTDKADYCPEETVLISGSGFLADTEIQITITRPDGTDVCPEAVLIDDVIVVRCGPLPEGSAFSDYEYKLDGITGEYTVTASDGTNTASTTFTDCVCNMYVPCTNNNPCYARCGDEHWYYGFSWCALDIGCPDTGRYCKYQYRVCADSDSTDGVPNIGGSVRTCNAQCDQDSDCPDVCDGKRTKPGKCRSGCSCGTKSPRCIQGSCGAECDRDSHCGAGEICIGCECAAGVRLNPQHDTYVKWKCDYHKNTNYDDKNLHVKWRGRTVDRRRSYLKFDLSDIPDTATITSAKLRLYQYTAGNGDTIGVYKVSNDKTAGGAWTETNLVWNNAPFDWSTGATTSVGQLDGYKKLTVAPEDVQSAISGNTLSLAVKFADEAKPKHHDFCDREASNSWNCDSTTVPELIVLYGDNEIPEFATIAIPAIAVLGLFLFFNKRKQRK